MSRPLSTQPGHAYAPGVEIPREPHPLVQTLYDLVDVALPAILLTGLVVILLGMWRVILGMLRRRRAAEREERVQREMMEEFGVETLEELRALRDRGLVRVESRRGR